MQPQSRGLSSLTLMPKSKKTLETSLDLTPSFKTFLDARVEGLFSNVDYLVNRSVILFKRSVTEKDTLRAYKLRSLGCNFFFVRSFYTVDDCYR